MKTGDIYFGKAEGLAKFADYPLRIKLIKKITEPHYSDKGDWIAVSYFVPKWAKPYNLEQSRIQIWTEAQINATFDTNESKGN